MTGEVRADLAAMSFENTALLIGGVALLIILSAAVFAVLVRKLGISSLGPVKIEQRGLSTMHSMDEEREKEDDACRRQMRNATGNMQRHIGNIFAEMKICTLARVAVSSAIRFPLYESVANNHFTSELMPDKYAAYRERMIEMMRDEYQSLSSVSKNILCNADPLPSWEQMKGPLTGCIDLWLKRVAREVMTACEKKITVYKKYLPYFVEAKDDFRIGIVRECIEKNERYITVLKDRAGREAAY